jgi:hypothetical protein
MTEPIGPVLDAVIPDVDLPSLARPEKLLSKSNVLFLVALGFGVYLIVAAFKDLTERAESERVEAEEWKRHAHQLMAEKNEAVEKLRKVERESKLPVPDSTSNGAGTVSELANVRPRTSKTTPKES